MSDAQLPPPAAPKSVSSASSWKEKSKATLTLPSGEVCVARRKGLESFIKNGQIPNALMPIMEAAMGGKAVDPKDLSSQIMDNPGAITDMFALFDDVCCVIMIDPKCYPVPSASVTRSDDVLYVDEIDATDKQFLFQWAVGGPSDLAKFRQQTSQFMDALLSSSEVDDTSVETTVRQG